MKLGLPLALLAAVFAAGCVGLVPPRGAGDDGWRLVFAADSEGRAVAGDRNVLMQAVRAGLPVRVGWGIKWTLADGTVGGVEHVAEAAFVSIYRGEVFAQLPPFLQQRPHPARADIALSTDDARFVVMLDTTGRVRHVLQPGGEVRDVRVATFWYVPWRSYRGPAGIDVPEELH